MKKKVKSKSNNSLVFGRWQQTARSTWKDSRYESEESNQFAIVPPLNNSWKEFSRNFEESVFLSCRRRWNYFLIPGQHSRAWQGQVVVSFVRQEVQGTRLRPQAHLQQARRESRRGIDSFFPFRYSPFLILCLKFCYFGLMTYLGGRPAWNTENFVQSSCVALWLVNFLLLNAVPVQVYWCTVNVEERWQIIKSFWKKINLRGLILTSIKPKVAVYEKR